MRNAHRGFYFVHILPTFAAGSVRINLQIFQVNVKFRFFDLRHHGYRGRGGVDAPLFFCLRYALNAVYALFILEGSIDVLSCNFRGDFFESADADAAFIEHLYAPSFAFGIACVHAVEVRGKKRGLIAAGAGADFHDDFF